MPVAVTYFEWSAWLSLTVALSIPPTFALQAAGRALEPALAAVGRVVLLGALVLALPDDEPALVFAAATGTAFLEGFVDTGLLLRFLRRLPDPRVR